MIDIGRPSDCLFVIFDGNKPVGAEDAVLQQSFLFNKSIEINPQTDLFCRKETVSSYPNHTYGKMFPRQSIITRRSPPKVNYPRDLAKTFKEQLDRNGIRPRAISGILKLIEGASSEELLRALLYTDSIVLRTQILLAIEFVSPKKIPFIKKRTTAALKSAFKLRNSIKLSNESGEVPLRRVNSISLWASINALRDASRYIFDDGRIADGFDPENEAMEYEEHYNGIEVQAGLWEVGQGRIAVIIYCDEDENLLAQADTDTTNSETIGDSGYDDTGFKYNNYLNSNFKSAAEFIKNMPHGKFTYILGLMLNRSPTTESTFSLPISPHLMYRRSPGEYW